MKPSKKYLAILLKNGIRQYHFCDIAGPKRKRRVVYYRMAYVDIVRKMYGLTHNEIGELINRNHSSTIYFCRQSDYLLNESPYGDYKDIYQDVLNLARGISKIDYQVPRKIKVPKIFSFKPKVSSVIP